ncbi:FAD dependent oxidoreductase [Choiromyces venosus 120613-1]|uniref:FAD dependent oxidoreductase n=1 Tax=Choiromyces venosus 120613-1 TaxID=1336337 RepID=A0A3N4J4G4_9PEZI|nr:FAD dependent oxidoreductase [Choiromyces venosus 120613-1]
MVPTFTPPSTIIIVGCGVFGLSTAHALSNRYPSTKVLVIDKHAFPCPYTASIDSSRIVRADYADPAYSALGREALKQWAGHPAFHKTGLVVTADGENKYLKDSYNNVKSGGGVECLPGEKDIRGIMAGGCSGTSGYVNWNSGWVDAEAAMRVLYSEVESRENIQFLTAEVSGLVFSGGKVLGVKLADGREITAGVTIIATGAWTPGLVPLHGRAVPSGQVIAYITLSQEETTRYANLPVLLNLTTGTFIIHSPNTSPPTLKVARHSQGYASSTPLFPKEIPREGEDALRDKLKRIVPEFSERPFEKTRVCWYTDTPDGDFLVTWHPEYEGLFIASGGSGHAFKFLPVLGDEIGDVLVGQGRFREKWGWKEPVEGLGDGSKGGDDVERIPLEEALWEGR